MTVQEFMGKYAVSLFAKVTPDGAETVRGEQADSMMPLYMALVGRQDHAVLSDYLSGQTLLPRMWGSGEIHCIMFPDAEGNVICMFLKYTGDAWELAEHSRLLMGRWLEEFEW